MFSLFCKTSSPINCLLSDCLFKVKEDKIKKVFIKVKLLYFLHYVQDQSRHSTRVNMYLQSTPYLIRGNVTHILKEKKHRRSVTKSSLAT